jgi:hypothetical protein
MLYTMEKLPGSDLWAVLDSVTRRPALVNNVPQVDLDLDDADDLTDLLNRLDQESSASAKHWGSGLIAASASHLVDASQDERPPATLRDAPAFSLRACLPTLLPAVAPDLRYLDVRIVNMRSHLSDIACIKATLHMPGHFSK